MITIESINLFSALPVIDIFQWKDSLVGSEGDTPATEKTS